MRDDDINDAQLHRIIHVWEGGQGFTRAVHLVVHGDGVPVSEAHSTLPPHIGETAKILNLKGLIWRGSRPGCGRRCNVQITVFRRVV